MQPIKIKIYVPRDIAVAAKSALYGETTYELSSEELGELTTLEATELLRFEGNDAEERLQLTGYDGDLWPLVKKALSQVVIDQVLATERRMARAVARIDLQRWAVNQTYFGKLSEQARLQYDVGSAYVFAVAQNLAHLDLHLVGTKPAIVTCTEQLDRNATFEQRGNPSLFALTIESRLRVEAKLLMAVCAPGTDLEVTRIARLTPSYGDPQTVVLARVGHPATGYGATVVWSAEDHRLLPVAVQELRDPGPEVG